MLNLSIDHHEDGTDISLTVNDWLVKAVTQLQMIAYQRSTSHGREIESLSIEITGGEAYGSVTIYKHGETRYVIDEFGDVVAEVSG
jgi:hypothetical protein